MNQNTATKAICKVNGMTCAACASSVEKVLSRMNGVTSAAVSYANYSALIEYDEDLVTFERMKAKLQRMGYVLMEDTEQSRREQEALALKRFKTLENKVIVGLVLSVLLIIIAMFLPPFWGENWLMLLLTLPIVSWIGREFYQKAWQQFQVSRSNMDTLVALGTGTAFVFSVFNTLYPSILTSQGFEVQVYYETAGVLITLILLGRYLEERAKLKTATAIKSLLNLQVKAATVIRPEGIEKVPIQEVSLGEILLIKPGENIPADGIITKGQSTIDEAMITGEATPVAKKVGDQVIGATLNQSGTFEMEVQQLGTDTVLSKIIKMVQQAQGSKAAIQHLVDQIAAYFVPTVILIAVFSAMIWYLIGPSPQTTYALLTLIAVLIIACPCALGLATPTAIMVGIGKGAKQGILIKDAQSLALLPQLDALVFDKTGTLTEGHPKVQTTHFFADAPDNLSDIIVTIEKHSTHPLANAIVTHYETDKIDKQSFEIDFFENITGKGVRAVIENKTYLVGNQRLLEDAGIDLTPHLERIQQQKATGHTLVLVAVANQLMAMIGIDDTIKPNAPATIVALQKSGLQLHLLTGDTQENAQKIAQQFQLKHIAAELLPEDKLHIIQQLQAKGLKVGMVGDGINDAPALAQADVGIAMGTGTDAAIESADVTLLQGDLSKIVDAITLAKATQQTIRQNLFWAFIYNIIGIPIAAGVLYPFFGFMLNPMIAGGAMALSSVSVVLNSLRLGQ